MEISQAVAAVGDASDASARVDLDATTVDELRHGLAELRTGISRLEAEFARMTHAADRVGAHIGTGARDTAEWVGKQTGTSTVVGASRATATSSRFTTRTAASRPAESRC